MSRLSDDFPMRIMQAISEIGKMAIGHVSALNHRLAEFAL
jgi:hypothetical protein